MKIVLETQKQTCLLLDDNGELYVEFTVGGPGVYDVRMKLEEYELGRLRYEGEKYLDRLADDVSGAPEKYAGRLEYT